jgi:energy-coupling factor transporter ATP-binding protein EcfA2
MTVADPVTPLLEARALSFHRQDEPVFAPLSFQLNSGELALVEGDNGSGKTTLLRILAGLLHVGDGELFWRGQPMQRDTCAGDVLFLGHQLGLKTDLSPRENLYGGFPPARRNVRRWRDCCCCRQPCGCSTNPTPTSTAWALPWSIGCWKGIPPKVGQRW